jgi:hypothetical protein
MSGSAMRIAVLATYAAHDAMRRHVGVLVLGPPLTVSRPGAAVLAARLGAHPALVLDVADEACGSVRVVGVLQAGEGLAAARALVDDYLPRARRATRPIARALCAEDLLGAADDGQSGASESGGERTSVEPRWAA